MSSELSLRLDKVPFCPIARYFFKVLLHPKGKGACTLPDVMVMFVNCRAPIEGIKMFNILSLFRSCHSAILTVSSVCLLE